MSTTKCIKPFFKKTGEGPFPCGKCPNCRMRRASDWSFRLMEEDKVRGPGLFLTLTYDRSNVPISKNGFMSLSKSHVQLFFKRLRKAHSRTSCSIKYYAVGEYGGNSRRPHYHIIAFGADISKIQPAWELGAVHYGTVSAASVGYTLKYITKTPTVPRHMNDDRLREFSLMSKDWGSHTSQMLASDGIRQISVEESTVISPKGRKRVCPGIIGTEFTPLKSWDLLRVFSKMYFGELTY